MGKSKKSVILNIFKKLKIAVGFNWLIIGTRAGFLKVQK
jgi:hypothetical protein